MHTSMEWERDKQTPSRVQRLTGDSVLQPQDPVVRNQESASQPTEPPSRPDRPDFLDALLDTCVCGNSRLLVTFIAIRHF